MSICERVPASFLLLFFFLTSFRGGKSTYSFLILQIFFSFSKKNIFLSPLFTTPPTQLLKINAFPVVSALKTGGQR